MKALDAYNAIVRPARRSEPTALRGHVEVLPRSPEPPTRDSLAEAQQMLDALAAQRRAARPQLPPPAPRTLAETMALLRQIDIDAARAKVALLRAVAFDESQTREDRADADDLAAGFERHAGFLIDVAAARRERGW